MFEKYSLKSQITVGVICGILNFAFYLMQKFYVLPLYLDTLFTMTASFLGTVSGILAAIIYHLFTAIRNSDISEFSWVICSITVVGVIRLYLRHQKKIGIADVLLMAIISAILISIEGAAIFTVLRIISEYSEVSPVRDMYYILVRNNIPMFFSALLPRVPANILDKGICTLLGFLLFKGVEKIARKYPEFFAVREENTEVAE